MSIKKILVLFMLLFPLSKVAEAQQKLDSLVKKFGKYREAALQEKMYAQLDRSFYLTGETLWFKVYTVDGSLHKPTDVSKVAYVEILDKANFAVLQGKIELRNGMGNGSFFIPASLGSGNYKFRIYTSWMKNFQPEFYFHQVIAILNPFVALETREPKKSATYRLDLFPEGGNLVAGIQSKVAFKISDDTGKGATCKGFVLNNRNDTVAAIAPEKFGLGHFLFTPSGDANYRAILAEPGGRNSIHPFPQAHASGYVMHVRDSGELLHVTVNAKGVPQDEVYLFVHARQIITRAERKMLHNNSTAFLLPKKDLQPGISHFTLFNSDLEPLCERLFFSYPDKELQIDITGNQKIFQPRRKVSVSLKTSKGEESPTAANLSMSVYKIDSLSANSPSGVYPYLWLGADLTGTFESPAYYFEREAPGVVAAMDNLMLTHGWRRFDWSEILENKSNLKFLPEAREHIVTGVVTKAQKAHRGVFAYLASPGKIVRAYGSWSNEEGQVRFEIKDFYGPRRIIIQTKTDSAEAYEIKLLDPFSQAMDGEKLPALTLPDEIEGTLLSRSIAMQVQDIYYYEPFGNRAILPTIDSSAFYGQADATYYLDDYTRFPVMEEVMREYVPGVFVRKRRDGFHFILVDYVKGGVLPGDPMVLLDGVPVMDVDDIMQMDPLRIRKLEVVKRPYYLGQAVFYGIVSYSTYQGDLGGLELDPRSISMNYDGLQLKREFYSPQYNRQQENTRMPDQRYLLHWEPNITTDAQGKNQVEFFTSDIPGRYLVVVEGISNEGYSGSKTYAFTVQPPDNP